MIEHGHSSGVRSTEMNATLDELKAGKAIPCNYGHNGRIHLQPLLNGEPAPAATGLITCTAQLRKSKDAIPHGVVDLAKIGSIDGYERPRWGGISHWAIITEADPTNAPLSGFDELNVFVERW
ncbi:hypothetical protein [Enterovibrio nigricans]|uniref:Uncharacterized protein n=1 Tax=Enterovibrio nigricans DSM 22720 TaxID=1121868 RepID=A0A1T4VMV8_9GAMM|nr:hypothetical protein [Enterovibrio nigricans]PKF49598.1 hypothetical protein AT251_17680 [Enterovibrio nigricans]SKA66198.1 hypothetical protein SAMN02745132_04076 [Enterovibrio nigricans DSM 22720]